MASVSSRPSVESLVEMMKSEASRKSQSRSSGSTKRRSQTPASAERQSNDKRRKNNNYNNYNDSSASFTIISSGGNSSSSLANNYNNFSQSSINNNSSASNHSSMPKVRPHYIRELNGNLKNLNGRAILVPRWIRENEQNNKIKTEDNSSSSASSHRSSFYTARSYPVTLIASLHHDTIDREIEKYELTLFDKKSMTRKSFLSSAAIRMRDTNYNHSGNARESKKEKS